MVDRLSCRPAAVVVSVPGRSYAHTRLSWAARGKTACPAVLGSVVMAQLSARSPKPLTRTMVGLPLPRQVR